MWTHSQVKTVSLHRNAALDVEPIYTFRAHRYVDPHLLTLMHTGSEVSDTGPFFTSGAVLALTMGEDGESCYSGGLDGSVRCWKMPDLNVDPYDNYGQSVRPSVPERLCPKPQSASL